MIAMKTSPPAALSRRFFLDSFGQIAKTRFFRDRLSVLLLALALGLNAFTFVWLLLKVHPNEVPVPVRYSNLLSGFDLLGPWYFPFLIAAYALVVTLVNAAFAYYSFGRSRLVSFFLLVAANVVGAFSLVVASAFGVVR